MDEPSRASEAQVYSANLDYTLKELQRKVKEHENELQKVSTYTLPQIINCESQIMTGGIVESTAV